jgi:hypothetical protein
MSLEVYNMRTIILIITLGCGGRLAKEWQLLDGAEAMNLCSLFPIQNVCMFHRPI